MSRRQRPRRTVIRDVAAPPVAADLLLGRDRVAGSQLIKQPDVLMPHHLVPDQVEPGSLGPNLDYYNPRTAHGSSLSPVVSLHIAAALAPPGRCADCRSRHLAAIPEPARFACPSCEQRWQAEPGGARRAGPRHPRQSAGAPACG